MNKYLSRSMLISIMVTGDLLMGAVSTAYAQSDQAFNLDQTVVTATRTKKAIIDAPANVQVITAEEIKNGGYSSVFEAVRNLTQADAHTYQEDGMDYGSMMSRIKLRGIDDGTLVLINGNPGNYMNHATLNNIPIDQVEKIEIVKGANSVLYGPQAIGGVINIITKKPAKTGKVTGTISGTVGSRIKGSSLNIQTDNFNAGIKKSYSRDFLNVEHAGIAGAGPALNIKDKSAEQMYLDINLTKELMFSYGRTDNKSDFETGKFINYVPNMLYKGNIDTSFNNYALIYNTTNGLRAVAGYNTFNCNTIYDKSYPKHYTDNEFWGYNANLDVQKKFDLRNDKDSFILGTTLTREHIKCNYQPSVDNETNDRNSYSLYQSYNHQITNKFNIITGLREYYMTSSKFQDSDFQVLPQLQGLYKVNDKSSYYFNIGKSFEMPDISSGFFYSSNYVVNSDLKPQSGWSYELGHKFADGKKTITADVFYMTVNNKFYWDKTDTGASIMKNRDKWKNTGLEVNYDQKINNELSADIGITWQNPKAYSSSTSQWTQDSAKYVINTGARYNKNKFMADARIFAYLDREPAYYNYERTSSKISDHNLKNSCDLTVTLSYAPTDVDSFKLVGRNLFNRDDVINNYEYYAMPANVAFTYERKF
ncbi:TonB-dependent receptor plug domain-containing protein [Pectinatus sottacetonis]|uniref:TonB-dependent receptor plug domain-containing protein n=1 Tax=Pectinatus sottacetonis TaxID=1002795 RepID=UPI0018C7E138|nr:TonB-dependent receptor [Pectinatus sottacetonis]